MWSDFAYKTLSNAAVLRFDDGQTSVQSNLGPDQQNSLGRKFSPNV